MGKYFLLGFLFFFTVDNLIAQQQRADSISALLSKEKNDSNKVTLMWKLADAYNIFKPDTALIISSNALSIAKRIKFVEGESRALGVLANAFNIMGNYAKALETYLKKLEIEETRNKPRNLASALMNIATVYAKQNELQKALTYYLTADSIINFNKIIELDYYSKINLGDVYDKLENYDAALIYFSKSIVLANKDNYFLGASFNGLGNVYFKHKKYTQAIQQFKAALEHLEKSDGEDLLCETTLGLAKIFEQLNINDSAKYFANQSYNTAVKDKFLSRELEAAVFLTTLYKKVNNIDSAFLFMERTNSIKEAINSSEKIKEIQMISINEQIRQNELIEQKKKEKEDRRQQLQLILSGVFIATFFLFTVHISNKKIHIRVIKFLGVISLLLLFEYLTLFLHPYVVNLTHHTPVLELLILVVIAAILIPAHHKIEHWFVEKLTDRNTHSKNKVMKIIDEKNEDV